ncbi:MAG TPA: hypothetical protein VHX14_11070 [Thermoanaerobaculia bacterium]|jgi:hypothetical protein|nr:hypothetical protein [Thermoanaerobaculia bacterium]
MARVTEATAKRLYAVSGNACAFPRCPLPLIDPASGTLTGRICHIRARNPKGARYDTLQTDEQRNSFENLILMCPIHHDVIDADEKSYTVERLLQLKQDHESNAHPAIFLSDETARSLISLSEVNVQQGSILLAVNQSGGQIAHTITNIHPFVAEKAAVLEPLILRVPHELRSEFSTLEVRLRNIGAAKPADARVTLLIPERMNRHSYQEGHKATRDGWVECERDNRYFRDQDLFEQLYPGDITRQSIFGFHYYLEPETAAASTDHFEIQIRSGDQPAVISRLTFAEFTALPQKAWHVLRPVQGKSYSEVVPMHAQ